MSRRATAAAPDVLVGESSAIAEVRAFLRIAAEVDASVLVTGETGTGKSLVARLLHRSGRRSRGPMVSVNCAGIPESLFESELFGHERGAFTGAHETRRGLFEVAHGGTLFLDEMGDLPRSQQAKLLSVLEEREVRRVGGSKPLPVDVRVVSATSRDLPGALAEGSFRRDLYHRLAVLRVTLPPLRARPEDIPPLARHLLRSLARKHRRPAPSLSLEVRARLEARPWPGNVRELAHVLEAGLILARGGPLEARYLERAEFVPSGTGRAGGGPTSRRRHRPDAGAGRYSFYGPEEDERELIRRALERHRGNKSEAARELGMARNTLRARIKRYGL